ncbi:MAG: 16S rRNA (cytosine(1402)-N(4))-methyltransferase RsmH [Deltaproteobacteria bacterium]|nr:16S rRNA (cytosine(1402)-N(4))-methyltransferase RsmH [Deltaproteobacteria bacterium]
MDFEHTSVLSGEVVRFLNCSPGNTYVDGTLGGGGHTLNILNAIKPDGKVIGIDWDEDAVLAAEKRLIEDISRVTIIRGNFADIKSILEEHHVIEVNGILLDLGVSSYHFEKPERGFSFRHEGYLDMRMDRTKGTSACDLVNGLSEQDLGDVIYQYGEERWARRIAKKIVEKRRVCKITTTKELADIVYSAIPVRYHPTSIHPATKTFQAIRIKVNNELENLKRAIDEGVSLLAHEGRFVVISYHSLEDRIVKERFRSLEKVCICPPDLPMCICERVPLVKVITKKPVIPSETEIKNNPRARSAKMRAAERI